MVFSGYSCFPFHPYISFFSLFFISKFCMSMIRVGYNICHERNTPHLPTAGWYRSAVPTVATCLPLTSQRTEVSYVNQSKLTFRKPFANSTTRFPDCPSMLPYAFYSVTGDVWRDYFHLSESRHSLKKAEGKRRNSPLHRDLSLEAQAHLVAQRCMWKDNVKAEESDNSNLFGQI